MKNGEGETVLPVRWWPKERFSIANPVCDACDQPLTKFPACLRGSYALCVWCQKKSGISDGDTEYFESFLYNAGIEPAKAGVNFGGRKVES